MAVPLGKDVSYWTDSMASPGYPALAGDTHADVVIIGGGIVGLTAAYFLKRAGLTVAVLEKGTIGSGVTGHTTGKVTSQHGLAYDRLARDVGREAARTYAEANQTAIGEIEGIITQEGIDCDWQRDDNYVFTERADRVAAFKAEARTARELGLPAEFTVETPLPFSVQGAVRFTGQAKFHSRKYLLGLAEAVQGNGGRIFERSKVKVSGIKDGKPCRVETADGTVTAPHVIMATNVPFQPASRGLYCTIEYPLQSYVVATKPSNGLRGMYITYDGPLRSILPVTVDGTDLLLVGGESHVPYFGGGTANRRYRRLAGYARERLNAGPVEYRWNTWDYLSIDNMPLIGKLLPGSKCLYVATAFMKWGLTNGTVSGITLADLIQGKENVRTRTFDVRRLKMGSSLPKLLLKAAKGR